MYWIISFIVSLVVGVIGGNALVPFLRRLKFGQEVREEGPQSHLKKQGTPTMGGLLFFIALPIGILSSFQLNSETLFLIGCAVLFGFIGLLDDGLKIVMHRSLGLRAWQKVVLQIVFTIIVLFWAIKGIGILPAFWLPGTTLVVGSLPVYVAIMFFVIIGTTNAANLTDGLDGLLSTVTIVVAVGFFVIGIFMNRQDVMVFSAALGATLIAFLFYNRYPAKMFMGDTGSFFIGGAVVGLAICTKTELLLPLLCLIYVAEALSVIIQVVVFKKTGKRVFRMSPLHHHFELGGLKETQVVGLFALVTVLATLLSLLLVHGVDVTIFS